MEDALPPFGVDPDELGLQLALDASAPIDAPHLAEELCLDDFHNLQSYDDDAEKLQLLRDLHADALVVNTDGPFYRGALGSDDYSVDAMHVVHGPARELRMAADLLQHCDCPPRATLLVVEDDVYAASLPPNMAQGRLLHEFLACHVSARQHRAFADECEVEMLSPHARLVRCTARDTFVSRVRVADAFVYRERDVLVLEATLPFLYWMNADDALRLHQVHNRLLRPGVDVYAMGAEPDDVVRLTISEPCADREAHGAGVVPSVLELRSVAVNVSRFDIANCKIEHKGAHAGKNNLSLLHFALRDKHGVADVVRYTHRFYLHNSGHTLNKDEKAWRNQHKQHHAHADLRTVEANTKQTMTVHQCCNPPLPRPPCSRDPVARKRKKKERPRPVVFVSRTDPPPLDAVVPPTLPPPASPSGPRGRTHSPLSPLELHKVHSDLSVYSDVSEAEVCAACHESLDGEDLVPVCDVCQRPFHLGCTVLGFKAPQELVEDEEYVCPDCIPAYADAL